MHTVIATSLRGKNEMYPPFSAACVLIRFVFCGQAQHPFDGDLSPDGFGEQGKMNQIIPNGEKLRR